MKIVEKFCENTEKYFKNVKEILKKFHEMFAKNIRNFK